MEIGRGRKTLTIIINKSQPQPEQEAAASSRTFSSHSILPIQTFFILIMTRYTRKWKHSQVIIEYWDRLHLVNIVAQVSVVRKIVSFLGHFVWRCVLKRGMATSVEGTGKFSGEACQQHHSQRRKLSSSSVSETGPLEYCTSPDFLGEIFDRNQRLELFLDYQQKQEAMQYYNSLLGTTEKERPEETPKTNLKRKRFYR